MTELPIPSTIDDTIGALRSITANGERDGYFAAMYLRVTAAVTARAAAGGFVDNARMERFVVAFAARYLDAHSAWRAGQPVTESWLVTLEATRRWRPVILQHLLLGMNAHINLDLAVVAADLAGTPETLLTLRPDFEAINDLLGGLVDGFRTDVEGLSPWLRLADRFGAEVDGALIGWSLETARRGAWDAATKLVALPAAPRAQAIVERDRKVAAVGRSVLHPGAVLTGALGVVRLAERAPPAVVIERLSPHPPTA